MRPRCRIEIYADILRVARKGARKTWIVYGANLNFVIVKRYLRELIGAGVLRKVGAFYHTTEKGLEYVDHVEAVARAEEAEAR